MVQHSLYHKIDMNANRGNVERLVEIGVSELQEVSK